MVEKQITVTTGLPLQLHIYARNVHMIHMTHIRYKAQGGFQLMARYVVQTPLRPEKVVREEDGFCTLMPDGKLHIEKAYVWDGPSTGPFKKISATKTFMRGSLVHDACHQLARQNPEFRKFKPSLTTYCKPIAWKME